MEQRKELFRRYVTQFLFCNSLLGNNSVFLELVKRKLWHMVRSIVHVAKSAES